ncbi:hypothetical protein BU26DRAFT_607342 [Trematosphaeria pertusa]|uniref:Uncharacterized protein n=1 Tax=Trematosphaeria pertusa TaxID=390896 RepID=A0A6A6I7L6_9PLEO|nr:uncharacterized protein BU26DRAFT_607342 [Trematosphaeria pertusa]KAF2246068.1 hypothetical protein BU26DRAFT_607342 [Trematosphaeria pertusa]
MPPAAAAARALPHPSPSPPPSTSSADIPTVTVTLTHTYTYTHTLSPSPSNPPSHTIAPHFAWPQRSESASLEHQSLSPPPGGLLRRAQFQTSTPTPASTPRKSTFPRPSPPTFLYPSPIVPARANVNTSISLHHRTLLSTMRDLPAFPDIPPALQALVFGGMALGFLWVVVVWLVNFPPGTWRCRSSSDSGSGRRSKKIKRRKTGTGAGARWWDLRTWLLGGSGENADRKGRKKKKPIDKPSKYAPLASSASSSSSSPGTPSSISSADADVLALAPTSASTSTSTSATRTTANNSAIELRRRNNPPIELPHPHAPGAPPWQTQRNTSLPPSSSSPSPQNPYLPTPPPLLRPRTSSEYLASYRAFFSSSPSSSNPVPASPSASTSSQFSFHSADALEAQTTPPASPTRKHRRGWSDSGLDAGLNDGKGKGERKRWSGAGFLDAVDGAVGRAVDRMVKWTGDDGGGEGLLLPLKGDKMD